MKREPDEGAVREQADTSEEQRLAEDHRGNSQVHGVAHEAVEAGDDQPLRRHQGRGRPEPLHGKPPEGFEKHGSPAATSTAPATTRTAANPSRGGPNRHREIQNGTRPTTKPGATARKTSDPTAATDLTVFVRLSQLLDVGASSSASGLSAPWVVGAVSRCYGVSPTCKSRNRSRPSSSAAFQPFSTPSRVRTRWSATLQGTVHRQRQGSRQMHEFDDLNRLLTPAQIQKLQTSRTISSATHIPIERS